MNYKLLTTLIVLPLAGCSGHSLMPSQTDTFKVDSVPVGASVLVLGESMGQTPISLQTRDVFPQNFDHAKQHLYGRIEISYPGCEPFITTVSSRIISNGLTARLNCRDSKDTPPESAVSPQIETTSQTEPTGLRKRLLQLKELFEEGLISEQDYAEKRRHLLEEL